MEKIRILIVDDSAFMRKSLSIMLGSDPDIEIVDTARDGLDGYEKAVKLKPDVVTLDIEMPRMDGLTALKKIMKDAPTSVIMVSSLTTEGAEATLSAMESGAVDFIAKEMSFVSVNIAGIKAELVGKVKAIVKQKRFKSRLSRIHSAAALGKTTASASAPKGKLPQMGYKAVALGISTGGPLSLQKVIPHISEKIRTPIFIVQHMPPKFTRSLADRLNNMSKVNVKEAENGETVKSGTVYIAPGGFHLNLKSGLGGEKRIIIAEEPSNTLHRPSVDVMMNSVIKEYGKFTLGVIMTGMGHDGTEGVKELKKLGGHCLAQDEASCVVYGMPKSIVDAGLADQIAPLEKIPFLINNAVV
ncbi:MAG: chemotaxis response regulator protein-glutamate methylesterase [Chlorobi bacterium]|nr:chemotaxis response regulator protein-glutamate methylesterase [Chlorobiota bacterium]